MTESPFSQTALQRHVDTALASIPPHHHHALIVRADGSSIGGAIAIRERIARRWVQQGHPPAGAAHAEAAHLTLKEGK